MLFIFFSKDLNKISSHFGIIRCNLYTLCSVLVWIILTTTYKFPRYACCCNCVSRERVNVNFLASVVHSVLHVSYHTIHQIRYYNPISSVEEEIWCTYAWSKMFIFTFFSSKYSLSFIGNIKHCTKLNWYTIQSMF